MNKKKPLGAISLRAPRALPAQVDINRNNFEENDEWPNEESFKLNQWERKDYLTKEQDRDFNDSSKVGRPAKKRNLPRSSRRKY